jgi:hypothetical protein
VKKGERASRLVVYCRRNGLELEAPKTLAGLANECVVDIKRSPRLKTGAVNRQN